MQVKDILDKMAHLESVFGVGARMYADDPAMGHKFICECYNEIKDNKEEMKKHFGAEVVEDIFSYVTTHPC